MSETSVLCLDAGRSGCRVRLHPATGAVAERRGRGITYVHGSAGVARVLEALDDVMAGLPTTRAEVVVAGVAGLREGAPQAAPLAAALAQRTAARRVVVTGDLVTAYVGALGLEPGVVVSAGTGAVALAIGADGGTARSDGWGYLLGDEGSGFWIGRAGLAAALASHDGRGGSAALRRRAKAFFGPLEQLPDALYGRADAVPAVAGFAPQVAAAARDGDWAAADLWDQAGRRLAAAAAAAAGAVPARVLAASWTGGLFAAGELLLGPLREELRDRAPHLRLRPPAGTALDGAHRLAGVDPLPPGLGYNHVV